MCLFQGDVSNVNATKILVSPIIVTPEEKQSWQLTVYSNKVAANGEAAMILPFPKSECKLVDFSHYPTLFDDLKQVWPEPRNSFSFGVGAESDSVLAVVSVGSYQVSIVPDLDDFSRLSDTFVLHPSLKTFLLKEYPTGFSFLVCKLDQTKQYRPLAYIHGQMKPGKLFVPTMHFHLKQKLSTNPEFFGMHVDDDDVDLDWDHEIYAWNSALAHCLPIEWKDKQFVGNRHALHVRSPLSWPLKFYKMPQGFPNLKAMAAYKIGPDYKANHDTLLDVIDW
jgi:hypothetical protein